MIKKLREIDTFLKTIIGIVISLGSILTALGFIYSGIIKLNNTVSNLAQAVPLVEEHGIFINQEVDYMIDKALEDIATGKQIARRDMSKLLVYRDTLPKSLSYKQRMNIDYIERKTNYK